MGAARVRLQASAARERVADRRDARAGEDHAPQARPRILRATASPTRSRRGSRRSWRTTLEVHEPVPRRAARTVLVLGMTAPAVPERSRPGTAVTWPAP